MLVPVPVIYRHIHVILYSLTLSVAYFIFMNFRDLQFTTISSFCSVSRKEQPSPASSLNFENIEYCYVLIGEGEVSVTCRKISYIYNKQKPVALLLYYTETNCYSVKNNIVVFTQVTANMTCLNVMAAFCKEEFRHL